MRGRRPRPRWSPGEAMSGSGTRRVTIKTCACGRAYDAEAWERLRLVGHVRDAEFELEPTFELRQCTCQSSLALRKSQDGGGG